MRRPKTAHGKSRLALALKFWPWVSSVRKAGLYANILAKQERIKAGSGERMRKPGEPGAPTAKAFKESAKTAKDVKKDKK